MSGSGSKLEKYKAHGSFDIPFFILTMILLTIGLIMLFSASYAYCYYNEGGDSLYYIRKQSIFAVAGVIGMIIVSKINYHVLRKFVWPILGLSLLLLVAVLFLPEVKPGFHRWISIPGLGTFQPSEIAKFAVVLLFAHLISINYDKMKTFKYGVLPYAICLAIMGALVFAENHLSGTILILAIGIVMMFIGGARKSWFIIGAILVVSLLALVLIFPSLIPHAPVRITAWLDKDFSPDKYRWQTNQSLYAIGSGGFLGVGIGNSKQKYLYVSEPQNDFIFAIVCEELGFIGAAIIVTLFVLLVWRGFVIAMRSPDKFGALLVIGLVFQVGLQTALNIAVVTDTIPNTGISLPFFSYGGTALTMLLLEMGVVLGVSRYSNMRKT